MINISDTVLLRGLIILLILSEEETVSQFLLCHKEGNTWEGLIKSYYIKYGLINQGFNPPSGVPHVQGSINRMSELGLMNSRGNNQVKSPYKLTELGKLLVMILDRNIQTVINAKGTLKSIDANRWIYLCDQFVFTANELLKEREFYAPDGETYVIVNDKGEIDYAILKQIIKYLALEHHWVVKFI